MKCPNEKAPTKRVSLRLALMSTIASPSGFAIVQYLSSLTEQGKGGRPFLCEDPTRGVWPKHGISRSRCQPLDDGLLSVSKVEEINQQAENVSV